ncbi:hypothetical protein V2I01_30570 [Micromonospora sp. BRA006-A]|nr:hypothetical protein [Micromonospora sp. BRA006-A]
MHTAAALDDNVVDAVVSTSWPPPAGEGRRRAQPGRADPGQ